MKLGNKTKFPDALLELSIDFGKRMGSGWSYLNDEALNCMQGFSKSTSPQRFKSNGGKCTWTAHCELSSSSYVRLTLHKGSGQTLGGSVHQCSSLEKHKTLNKRRFSPSTVLPEQAKGWSISFQEAWMSIKPLHSSFIPKIFIEYLWAPNTVLKAWCMVVRSVPAATDFTDGWEPQNVPCSVLNKSFTGTWNWGLRVCMRACSIASVLSDSLRPHGL